VATQHMMCPACLGHGKYRDDTRCDVCKGTGSVTMRQGDQFLTGKVQAKADSGTGAASPAKGPGRHAKKGSASKASKARARKAHAQQTRKVAQAASGKGAAE
jgi:DnaJ-class molecular chaperone